MFAAGPPAAASGNQLWAALVLARNAPSALRAHPPQRVHVQGETQTPTEGKEITAVSLQLALGRKGLPPTSKQTETADAFTGPLNDGRT